MAKSGGSDLFANAAVITVTETAANTLTFKKLETGISLFEKIAWIIHRVEYFHSFGITQFADEGDSLGFGLTTTDQLTTVAITNAAVIDINSIIKYEDGAPATSWALRYPVVKDLTTLPSGGIIVPPNPLYAYAQGTGLASAATVNAKLYYTTRALSPDEYWELVESRRIISS